MIYILDEKYRNELRKPLGDVVKYVEEKDITHPLITVGDAVSSWMFEHGIKPDIYIVDYMVERKKAERKFNDDAKVLKVKNPAGVITQSLWDAIKKAYEGGERIRIEVEGEEDLAALPAILMAPANATIIYGLPSHGMVVVKAGEKERKIVGEFLKKIERDENGD